jgi:hypothetical protein
MLYNCLDKAMSFSRDSIIAQLHKALLPLPFVHAAWLEGADAAGRADEYSDIDLWLDVDQDSLETAFEAVRSVLLTFGSLDLEDVQVHSNPLLQQRFFRSSGVSPFWFVDVCVQVHGRDVAFGADDPFLVLFDRKKVIQVQRLEFPMDDINAAVQGLQARRWRWLLVEKEIKRGHRLEALVYYHQEVLQSLVELLRLRHCPGKRGYDLKHTYLDLPKEVNNKLEVLYGYSSFVELQIGLEQATRWFEALLEDFS